METPGSLRPVRARLTSDAKRVRVRADGPIVISESGGETERGITGNAWRVIEPDSRTGINIGEVRSTDDITLTAESGVIEVSIMGQGEWGLPRRYPGRLRLVANDARHLTVINYVDIEPYVACVVASEIWPDFHDEAYRAQAIVARTYVLQQMRRRRNAEHDIRTGESTQAYRGLRTDEVGRRARAAARYSRGVVCTTPVGGTDRLFTTYYSAVCGGVTQSGSVFGESPELKPLAGGVACDYCRIAPGDTYRWGPVRLSTEDVRLRLAARDPAFERFSRIRSIAASERTAAGRALAFRVEDSDGRSHVVPAETLRLAIGARVLKSSEFTVTIDAGEVRFADGRGFGHGVGLCQWGMQGQALAGKKAGEILRHYYPGSKLSRVQ
ncbi:MAG: SpoIID/LytB domain-containing protein [Planctomycetes bacterium]|nr:SpoIID/LytB domain-containing protein [Planctomycetota bacterium]